MKEHIIERVKNVAEFFIETRSTVRETGKHFNISKTTVHYDLTLRLPSIDPELFEKIRVLFDVNIFFRTIRGGKKTQEKFSKLRESKKYQKSRAN
jgi:putative DeoR family transcriptional regulator (stage III sporulation protein D)